MICTRIFAVLLLALSAASFADDIESPEVFTTREAARVLPLPDDEDAFHFIIFGDRTGGPPEGIQILEQAVRDTNLLDPDLVMTVGDLVNGFNKTDQWLEQMREFRGVMEKLDCPWYPVAGNHDVYWDPEDPNKPPGQHEGRYEEHFGPLWYSFRYKQCGFIVLYTDEGDPKTGEKGIAPRMQQMSPEQIRFLRSTLTAMQSLQHVFVFAHHPRWLADGYPGNNWNDVHRVLADAGNVTAVFGGHIHRMTYDGVRDGIQYYTLAATGAVLPTDVPAIGFLHHFNVVTIRKDRMSMAAVPVGTVIDPKLYTQEFLDDVELASAIRPIRQGEKLTVGLDGAADAIYEVALHNPTRRTVTVTLSPDADRDWTAFPDHRHRTIEAGQSGSTKLRFVRSAGNGLDDLSLPTIRSTVEYHSEHARFALGEGQTSVELALNASAANPEETGERGFLSLTRPESTVQVDADAAKLPDGPLTIEAWVRMGDGILRGHGFVAMSPSEYGLFFNGGTPEFVMKLNDQYVSVRASTRLKTHEWTHVAGVFDGREVRIYYNGRHAGAHPAQGKRLPKGQPLFVGMDPNDHLIPVGSFRGDVDEFRLSATERYTENFEPRRRMETDGNTIVLHHFDRKIGPFLQEAVSGNVSARLISGATVVSD